MKEPVTRSPEAEAPGTTLRRSSQHLVGRGFNIDISMQCIVLCCMICCLWYAYDMLRLGNVLYMWYICVCEIWDGLKYKYETIYIEREKGVGTKCYLDTCWIIASLDNNLFTSREGTRRPTPSLGSRCQVVWETQSRNIRVRRSRPVLASDCWAKGCTCIKRVYTFTVHRHMPFG